MLNFADTLAFEKRSELQSKALRELKHACGMKTSDVSMDAF